MDGDDEGGLNGDLIGDMREAGITAEERSTRYNSANYRKKRLTTLYAHVISHVTDPSVEGQRLPWCCCEPCCARRDPA